MDLKYRIQNSPHAAKTFSRKTLCYNPVEQHLVQLRQCIFELKQLNCKAKALKKIKDGKQPIDRKKVLELREYSIPRIPLNYPYSLSSKRADKVNALLKQRGEIKVKMSGNLTGKQMAMLTQNFVKSVLMQTGYFVSNSPKCNEPVEYLVNATNRFLANFVFILRRNKSCDFFANSDDLMGPLESTLREIGFGGITGVHKFYYEKIVKKHDKLFHECKEELVKYNRQRKEIFQHIGLSKKKIRFFIPAVLKQESSRKEKPKRKAEDSTFRMPEVPPRRKPHIV